MKILLALLLIFTFSCSNKKEKKADLTFALGNMVDGEQMPGGVYVWAEKQKEDQTFEEPERYDLDDNNSAIIPHGVWKIHMVAWKGPEPYYGQTYCGTLYPLILNTETHEAFISLKAADCYMENYVEMRKEKVPPVEGCPDGYIAVIGNNTLGTSDFCVMKYEARNVGDSPASVPEGTPWTLISAFNAFTKCSQIVSRGYYGKFAMISNPEWMTLARDIESVDTNWSNGTVGDGTLARGWSAYVSYGDSWTNTTIASDASESCLYNTGDGTCSSTGEFVYKRTQDLSGGGKIWDLAGHLFEWVDWSPNDDTYTLHATPSCGTGWKLFTTPCNDLEEDDYLPLITQDYLQGIGRYAPGTGGAAFRGGRLTYGHISGVFTLELHSDGTNESTSHTFRCVYRP